MMDCSEIRTLLSEYLDDALDENAKARVDEHLRTCPACQKELDSLKAFVKGIGSLESVKAPADFLDQLHKRLERRSRISEVWERLFYPLRVKIPLQLAGAAVMAIIIFSILPLQQPSLKLPSKPEQVKKAEDAANYADESKEGKSAARPEALVQKAAPGGVSKDKDSGKSAVRSESLVQRATTREPVKDKEIRELTLNLKQHVLAKASPEPPGAPVPASPAAAGMQRQKLATRAPAQEDKKEDALEKEPDPVFSITKAIEAAKGKVLSVDYNPQTGLPESIHAEMPDGEISRLYEKLRELGELQVSPGTGAGKDSDLVPIKIRLIGLQ
jgi:hypothetical protein